MTCTNVLNHETGLQFLIKDEKWVFFNAALFSFRIVLRLNQIISAINLFKIITFSQK